MSGHVRLLDSAGRHDWRTAQADALEAAARTIDDDIGRLEDLTGMFAGDEPVLRAISALCAFLRSARNDRLDQAQELRGDQAEPLE
jgi:hypothetical protein